MKTYKGFRDEFYFLSNMFPCDCEYKGYKFTCSEALFQALKCKHKKDIDKFVGIDGYTAKRIGRKIELRSDWNEIRLNAMKTALYVKFVNNIGLRSALRNTGDIELIEVNSWNDRYWGVCNGVGENNLGKLLMEFRSKLK